MEIGTIILSAKIVFYLLGAMSILLVIIAIKPIAIKIKNMVMGAKGYGIVKYLSPTGHWIREYVKFGSRMDVGDKTFLKPKELRATIDEGIATIHYPHGDSVPVDFHSPGYDVLVDSEGKVVLDAKGEIKVVEKPNSHISPEEMKAVISEAEMLKSEEILLSANNDMKDMKLIFVGALALLVAIAYLCFQNYSVLTSMQHAAGLA